MSNRNKNPKYAYFEKKSKIKKNQINLLKVK